MKKHLILFGGTRGLGLEYLKNYGNRYQKISLISRGISSKINKYPRNVKFYQVDISKMKLLEKSIKKIVKEQGEVDSIAFFQRYRGGRNTWKGNLDVTLSSVAVTLNCLKNSFSTKNDKSVLMIASIASNFVAWEQDEGYHAAKSGLLGLMRYYANYLGPLGVRVNAISPGVVLKKESKNFYTENIKLFNAHRSLSPLGRMGTAKEVSHACHFLLDQKSSFITGQEIVVDGGVGIRSHASSVQMERNKK